MSRALLILLVCSLLATSCGESAEGKFGADLFEVSCARCHGDTGEGSIGPAIGTGESNAATGLSDEQIFGAIRVGPGSMPGFARLSDEQVESLVGFLRELQTGE